MNQGKPRFSLAFLIGILFKVEIFAARARQFLPFAANPAGVAGGQGIFRRSRFCRGAQNRWFANPYSNPAQGLK